MTIATKQLGGEFRSNINTSNGNGGGGMAGLSRKKKRTWNDLDGTWWCWASYWVPVWRDRLPWLAKTVGITTQEACRCMAREIVLTGSHEDPWILPRAFAGHWQGSVRAFRQEVEEPFARAMDDGRARWLRAYSTLVDTLGVLTAVECPVYCISDAPYPFAVARFYDVLGRHPRALQAVHGLYAIHTPVPSLTLFPGGDPAWVEFGCARVRAFEALVDELRIPHTGKLKHHKPHPDGIGQVLADLGLTLADTKDDLVIGDSVKDGWLAEVLGCDYARAYYGQWPEEYRQILNEDLRYDGDGPAKLPKRPNPTPTATIHFFEQILPIIGIGSAGGPFDSNQELCYQP